MDNSAIISPLARLFVIGTSAEWKEGTDIIRAIIPCPKDAEKLISAAKNQSFTLRVMFPSLKSHYLDELSDVKLDAEKQKFLKEPSAIDTKKQEFPKETGAIDVEKQKLLKEAAVQESRQREYERESEVESILDQLTNLFNTGPRIQRHNREKPRALSP